jgi:hypothetical protein
MIVQKTTKEYRKLEVLSSSDLRSFANNRRKFYREVVLREKDDSEEEEYDRSLLIGDITHTLLLQPETFDSKFHLSVCPAPPTGKMLAFTEALYKRTVENSDENGCLLVDFEDIATQAHMDAGYSGKAWGLSRVLRDFENSNGELYFKELREVTGTGKQVVCIADLTASERIKATLMTHEYTSEIFERTTDDRYIVLNEWQNEGFDYQGLKLKAMLDKIIIDTEDRTIDIYDLKCVWNNTDFYRTYYLKRRAYIQALVYFYAVSLSEIFPVDVSDYLINPPIFVAADSGDFYAPIKYQLLSKDLKNAALGFMESGRQYKGVDEIVEDILWSFETQNWRSSKEIFDKKGYGELK